MFFRGKSFDSVNNLSVRSDIYITVAVSCEGSYGSSLEESVILGSLRKTAYGPVSMHYCCKYLMKDTECLQSNCIFKIFFSTDDFQCLTSFCLGKYKPHVPLYFHRDSFSRM